MINLKHEWKLKWDYSGVEKANIKLPLYTQEDWNQTLITKINQLGAQIARTSVRSVKRVIRANERIINKLIKTQEYYNSETDMLSARYKIVIDNLIIDDSLYVYSDLLFEKPMLVPDKEVGFFDIQKFSFASDIDQKDVDLYTRKLVGKINIINYGKEN